MLRYTFTRAPRIGVRYDCYEMFIKVYDFFFTLLRNVGENIEMI